MTKKYKSYDMSPDDCVEIAQMYAEKFFGNARQVVELGMDRIPPELLVEQLSNETGLDADEIRRFADIGDFVLLDRQLRGMSEEERFEWEEHKKQIVSFVDNVMTENFIEEVVAKRERFEDDRRTIEEIWKASEKSEDEIVIEKAQNMTKAETRRLLEMIFDTEEKDEEEGRND